MRATSFLFALLGLFTSVAPASAQVPSDLRNVLGGMVHSAITRATQAQWNKVSPTEVACIDQALRRQGKSLQAMVQHGVMPSDARLSSLRSACRNQNPQQPALLPPPAVSYGRSHPPAVICCAPDTEYRRTPTPGFDANGAPIGDTTGRWHQPLTASQATNLGEAI